MSAIFVYRGKIEGWVKCSVKCFLTDGISVCAYISNVESLGDIKMFYKLDLKSAVAYPNGVASTTLANRIKSENEFLYRRRKYRKLTQSEARPFIDQKFTHILPVGPSSAMHLMFT